MQVERKGDKPAIAAVWNPPLIFFFFFRGGGNLNLIELVNSNNVGK